MSMPQTPGLTGMAGNSADGRTIQHGPRRGRERAADRDRVATWRQCIYGQEKATTPFTGLSIIITRRGKGCWRDCDGKKEERGRRTVLRGFERFFSVTPI